MPFVWCCCVSTPRLSLLLNTATSNLHDVRFSHLRPRMKHSRSLAKQFARNVPFGSTFISTLTSTSTSTSTLTSTSSNNLSQHLSSASVPLQTYLATWVITFTMSSDDNSYDGTFHRFERPSRRDYRAVRSSRLPRAIRELEEDEPIDDKDILDGPESRAHKIFHGIQGTPCIMSTTAAPIGQ